MQILLPSVGVQAFSGAFPCPHSCVNEEPVAGHIDGSTRGLAAAAVGEKGGGAGEGVGGKTEKGSPNGGRKYW